MAKIKTCEATDVALDWLAAKCQGFNPHIFTEPDCGQSAVRPLSRWCGIDVSPAGHTVFAPSTDWAQGGPIIEREKIATDYDHDTWNAAKYGLPWCVSGPTPLVAAMRCYCCDKLGDEIDIPEELCQQQSS